MFKIHWVSPKLPTTLGSREWLPLPATDYCFYPMVNTWLYPEPLDTEKLKSALSAALQVSPLNCAELDRHPVSGQWQLHLNNRAVPLRIGTSPRPGPFGANWQGEKDPHYYDELPRSGADLGQYSAAPLTKIMVTTYEATGQTAIMLSQSYNLGDGFAVACFMKTLSAFYQGLKPDFIPTYEKYLMPEPQLALRGSYIDELKYISWLAGCFDDKYHHKRSTQMMETTSRIEVDLPAEFVDHLKDTARAATGIARLSSGDAFAGYLANVLFDVMGPAAPKLLSQCVGYRGQTITSNESSYRIPSSSMGTCYIIQTFDAAPEQGSSSGSFSKRFYDARRALSNNDYLSRVYAMYNHLYKTAALSDNTPFDSGHQDALAINNVFKLRCSDAHFGFPGECGWIEWEVLENFVQIQESNPRKRSDGSCRQMPGELTLITRLKHDVVPRFLRRLEEDVKPFQKGLVSRVLRRDPKQYSHPGQSSEFEPAQARL